MSTFPGDARAGAAVYNRLTLGAYDRFVLGFTNDLVWRCPSELLLAHYQRHVGLRHLDIGVGTGYFLDCCRFAGQPRIVLADLNTASLRATAARLARYAPVCHELNVLEPFSLTEAPFDSVGMNYLLHCLPGDMAAKAAALRHAAAQLRPGGVLFGSTVLGEGVRHNALGRVLMAAYNRQGIFGNRHDSLQELRTALQAAGLARVEIRVEGVVALFAAYRPESKD